MLSRGQSILPLASDIAEDGKHENVEVANLVSSVTTSESTGEQSKFTSVDNATNQSCALLHQSTVAIGQVSCSTSESLQVREHVTPVDLLNDDLLISSSSSSIPTDSEDDKNYVPSPEESSGTDSDNGYPLNLSNRTTNISDNLVGAVNSVTDRETKINRKVTNKTVIRQQGKKRVRHESQWLRNKRKASHAAGKAYVSGTGKKVPDRVMKPPCSCRMRCHEKITERERTEIFRSYWDVQRSNDMRWQFICSCIETKPVARCRSRLGAKSKANSFIYRFSLNKRLVQVCKTMFLNTICISNTVAITALKKEMPGGLVEHDRRGKHIPSNKTKQEIIENVYNHIDSFPTYESHYSRERSERKFLGSHLNIEKMYALYREFCAQNNSEPNNVAKKWLYADVFNKKFNLSFKPPRGDTCATCDSFTEKIKGNVTQQEKDYLQCKYDEHLLESKTRYDMKRMDTQKAKDNPKHKVITADLQKGLPTPHLNNNISFYKRKLWTFNFTIFDSSDCSACCMMWDESKGGRGGNEFASALWKWASCTIPNTDVEEITIWTDNCYAQNKNMCMIMCFFWILHNYPQIRVITQKFLLKGHTHMEADTVHAMIERKKKKMKYLSIVMPWDWQQLVRQCSNKYNVYNMEIQDFKNFKPLYIYSHISPFIFRKVTTNKQLLLLSKCAQLQVRQGNVGVLYFKTSFDANVNFLDVNLIRNSRKVPVLPLNLNVIRKTCKPISIQKYKDLVSLLPFLPSECHAFYKNLKFAKNIKDYPEDDSDVD